MTSTVTQGAVHVMIRDEGKLGVWITSPQLPGFSFFRATATEARAELAAALRYAAPGVETGKVTLHYELRRERPSGEEYVLRVAEDERKPVRHELAQRIERFLSDPAGGDDLLASTGNPVGEVVFVCGTAEDSLSWVLSQLEDEDAVIVTLPVTELGIWTMPFESAAERRSEFKSLAEWGWSEAMTLGQVMMDVDGLAAASRGVLVTA